MKRENPTSIDTEAKTDFPKRTADTMSDAIALSSPSGRMSKRAFNAASKRLHDALFGTEPYSLKGECPQPGERERLLRAAADLRDLADRGMSSSKFYREALRLEALAELQP